MNSLHIRKTVFWALCLTAITGSAHAVPLHNYDWSYWGGRDGDRHERWENNGYRDDDRHERWENNRHEAYRDERSEMHRERHERRDDDEDEDESKRRHYRHHYHYNE